MSSKEQCHCLTAKRVRCSRSVYEDTMFCFQHQDCKTPVSDVETETVSESEDTNLINILSEPKEFDLENANQKYIDAFKLLITQIEHQIITANDPKEKNKHRFRLQSINKAINILQSHPGPIKNGTEAQKIQGIGKGIGARIDEINKTGTLAELTEKEFVTDLSNTIQELEQVSGIGEVTARQLVEEFGVKSVADLKNRVQKGEIKVTKNQITHHILIGLKYYEDFMKKIPRQESASIEELLLSAKNTIDTKLILQVCGSYRRGRLFSGDIDVLMTHPDLINELQVKSSSHKYLIELVDLLIKTGFIVDSLTDKGQTKYMGVCRLGDINRRIDIRFVPYDSYAPALMYFTGSSQFNKIFRGIANDRGYTLNEYGIYEFKDKIKGDKIPVFSEEDIFKLVGVKYMTPKQRDL